jgi:hypothetical protein
VEETQAALLNPIANISKFHVVKQPVLQTPLSFALIIQRKNGVDEEIKFTKFCTYAVKKYTYISCMNSTV